MSELASVPRPHRSTGLPSRGLCPAFGRGQVLPLTPSQSASNRISTRRRGSSAALRSSERFAPPASGGLVVERWRQQPSGSPTRKDGHSPANSGANPRSSAPIAAGAGGGRSREALSPPLRLQAQFDRYSRNAPDLYRPRAHAKHNSSRVECDNPARALLSRKNRIAAACAPRSCRG